ncbi:MAG: endolytic transglycosylase MltG [Oscillospiraceae bacterium]|nr:endolytic transglycosylase MltG [Oscillospiraceae bacterium]
MKLKTNSRKKTGASKKSASSRAVRTVREDADAYDARVCAQQTPKEQPAEQTTQPEDVSPVGAAIDAATDAAAAPNPAPKKTKTAKSASGKGAGKKKKKKKKKRLGAGTIALLVILALAVSSIGAAIWVVSEISGDQSASFAKEFTVEVPDGASTTDIARLLKQNGLISSVNVFKVYCRLKNADGTFQLGEHTFNTRMGYNEIVNSLQTMVVEPVKTFTLTIPDGKTALWIAMRVETATDGAVSVDSFIDACNNDTFDVGFFDQISSDPDKFIKMDGFLWPDTYEFAVNYTAHDIIQILLEHFESNVLTEERVARINASGHSLEDIIKLASIVQKESSNDEPKSFAMVAGVFWNRLNNWSPAYLESDTSREWVKGGLGDYAFDNEKGYIPGVLSFYYEGYYNIPENIRDAYDTYTHEGLLAGAICNPGINAIDGTITPEQHDYYFFFTGKTVEQGGKPYGDEGTFYYFKTYAEHAAAWDYYGVD